MKNSKATDKKQNPRRLIIQGEERKQKKVSNLGLFAVQMLHKSSMCSVSTDLISIDSFIIPLSQPCQLVFCATRRYQSFLIFGPRLTISLPCETQSAFVRLGLQIYRFTSEQRETRSQETNDQCSRSPSIREQPDEV